MSELPTVTIVFLVFNRRDELRTSLERMTRESDYPQELVDIIVVDNASEDGAAEMVRAEFSDVELIEREENCGVSGWNDGLKVAGGEWVLLLDDDCYLPPDGLRRAVLGAQQHEADLVSFAVLSSEKPGHRFDKQYRTGLLTFWGCSALVRGEVLKRIGGYDPNIFVWANEVEFMLRFYDAGFRHLHMPEIEAVHMKGITGAWRKNVGDWRYRMNHKNIAYTAAKHLRARQAAGALMALFATHIRDALRGGPRAAGAIGSTSAGFVRGLRNRRPVSREISRVYRRHFLSFASPWWVSRPLHLFLLGVPGALVRRIRGRRRPAAHPGRWQQYFERGARYYPTSASTLEM
jgi:GT2 family glycosyltransferase